MTEQNQIASNKSLETGGDEISLLDILQVIVENLRLLLVVPFGAGLLALGVSFMIAPTFTAVTQILPPQQQQSAAVSMLQSLGSLGGLAGAATGLKNPVDQYVAFLKSRSVQDALINRFKLMEHYDQKNLERTRLRLGANTRISAGKEGLIAIEIDDKNAEFSAKLANAYVEELGHLLNRLAVTEAQQRRLFFEKQLSSTKNNLIKAEQVLNVSGVNRGILKINPQVAVEGLAKLKAAITAQEVKLASMRGYLTENATEFKQAQSELVALQSQMDKAGKEEHDAGSEDSDYIAKFRDFKYYETLFELFSKQYEIARVDESREGALIQVLDIAVVPEHESAPKKSVIVLSVFVCAGILMLIFVFMRQVFDIAMLNNETASKLNAIQQSLKRIKV